MSSNPENSAPQVVKMAFARGEDWNHIAAVDGGYPRLGSLVAEVASATFPDLDAARVAARGVINSDQDASQTAVDIFMGAFEDAMARIHGGEQ